MTTRFSLEVTPSLIQSEGKKFDLRIYVLVSSYKPLKVWIYNKGFGRFCNEQYSSDVAEMDNMFVHLTNVAIQQYSDKYSEKHGGTARVI